VSPALFGDRQAGLGCLGAVFGEPAIPFEAETCGFSTAPHIDLDLHLTAAEDDPVVLHQHVPAGDEFGCGGLLEYAENPFLGKQDGVARELRAIDSDEGCGA